MVSTRIEGLGAIAATEGIDVLFIGPADLSQSYGIPGQFDHELIRRAVDATATACKRHGKGWGMPVNSAEHANVLIEKRARFLCYGDDQTALVSGFRRARDLLRGLKV